MGPTVSELRRITQDRPDRHDFYMWAVMRKISVYVTWVFARTKVTPNQVTLLSIFFGATGAAFFLSQSASMWILGWFIIQLNLVLDQSDGELARYRGRQTKFGALLDEINHPLVNLTVFSAITIGVFETSGLVVYLYFGLLSVLGMAAIRITGLYQSHLENAMLIPSVRKASTPRDVAGILMSIPTGLGGYLHMAAIPAVMDVLAYSLGFGLSLDLGWVSIQSFRQAGILVFGVIFPLVFIIKVFGLRRSLKDTKI
jgi:phosphatidylglycerophosphate synthase